MNARMARNAAFAWLMALPVASIAVTPTPAAAGKAAVRKLEQRWIADIAQGNRDDLAAILADDYRDINWQGHVRDKQALLAGIHKSTDTTQRITQLHVRVWSDSAVATGTNEVHSIDKGRTVEVSFTDVFARIKGHWLAVSSQETVRKPSKS